MLLKRLKQAIAVLALTVLVGVSGMAIVTRLQGGHLLSVQTGSMVPVINKGDLVSVTRVPAADLAVGDIVTFVNPANSKQTITHRIIELPNTNNGQKLLTKGDANQAADAPIDSKAVVGQVRYTVPYAGHAVDTIRHPVGLALIIYVPALAIIIAELKRLAAFYKSQEVYALPWRRRKRQTTVDAAMLLPVLVVVPLLIMIPARAALRSQAVLTGNTITATRPVTPVICQGSSNSTVIIISGTGGAATNVSNSSSQTATTGAATSTGGGSATSGNATNCNSTSITIQ